ncbi:hypothetical protein ACJZ2D_004537 [Fusarium nematophilum]
MDPELDIKDAGKMVDDGCSAPNQITSKDVDSRLVRLDPFGLPLKPTPTEDPLDPLNWSKPKRYFVIFLACFGGFLTLYVTTNTVQGFFLLMDLYDATYSEVNWTIAVSSLGILAAILLLSSLAEVYGRRKVMILPLPEISTGPHYRCHVIVGFNIISDLSWEHEVGLHAGLLVIAVDLGFTLGAIFSGFTASAGPYWAQYHVVIMYGILAALCFFFLPETLYPRHTILEMIQNGETLENLTRTKQIKPWTLIRIPGFQHDPVYQTPISFIKGFSRYRLLIVCFAFSFFQYSWVTAFLSMAPAANAAFDIRVQGLLFIGFALGILIAEVFCSGRLSDIICSKIALKEGGERRPEMRLYLGYPAVAVNAVGLCVWGLSAQYQWHWMAGQVGMFLIGMGPPKRVMAFYAIFLNAASFVVPFYINLWVIAVGYNWSFVTQGFLCLLVLPVYVFLQTKVMASPNTNSAVPKAAPYGHACAACSRAKCRCISRGLGGGCERCHRLKQECTPSTVVRKRLPRRPARKTDRLEEKLDDLVTLLHAQAAANTPVSEPSDRYSKSHTDSESRLPAEIRNRSTPNGLELPSAQPSVSPAKITPIPTQASSPADLSPSQASGYLDEFRLHHLKWLPLVYIAPDVTPSQLQRERPFLWLNICTVCCKSTSEKKRLDREIREILARGILVDLERNLDLLLGLIVYLAWVMNHMGGKQILSSFSHLAMSLLIDLRLDRPGQDTPCNETDSYKAFSYPIKQIAALLRLQPMRWTSHMEESLQHLLHQPETLGDEVLVAIAEISKITDDITMAFPLQPVNLQATGQPLTPPTLYVKSLLMRVEATKKVLRQELSDNEVIQSYLYNATMMINSLPIANTFCAESLPGVADFGKTDCIFACIDAIKKGLDNWLAVADKDRWGMTVAPLLQFGRCCHTLYRVYMTEDPAWDRFRVRNAVDVIQILEQGAQAMEAVPRAVGLQGDGDDFFSRSAMALRSTILIWKKAFVDSEASAGFGHGAQLVAAPTQPSVSDLDFMQMDFSHDGWLEEIFTW